MDSIPQIKLTLSEQEFSKIVTDYATLTQWRWTHFFPLQNKRGRFITPLTGHPGMPDIVLARGGSVLLVELKRQSRGVVSVHQRMWLTELGEHGRLWFPSSWNSGEIIRTLRHYGREPVAASPT